MAEVADLYSFVVWFRAKGEEASSVAWTYWGRSINEGMKTAEDAIYDSRNSTAVGDYSLKVKNDLGEWDFVADWELR